MSERIFNSSIKIFAAMILALLATHSWIIHVSGYYFYPWIDIPMHFWGGMTTGMFFIWLFYYSGRLAYPNFSRPILLLLVISFGALIGVGWEFFEFSFDTLIAQRTHWPSAQLGIRDTMSDLLMDLLGAAFVGIIFISSKVCRTINIQS
jgi:hypothetical protein